MDKRYLAALGASVLLSFSLSANSSEVVGENYFYGAASFIEDDEDRGVDSGYAGWQAGLGRAISEHFNVEGYVQALDLDGGPWGPNDVNTGQDQTIFGLNVLNMYNRDGWFSPYLLAGIGYVDSDYDAGGSDNNFQGTLGGGFLVDLFWDRLSFRGEALYRYQGDDELIDDSLSDWLFNAGLSFAIGPRPVAAAAPLDSDGDGVTDDIDQCPNTPAGVTVDEVGCPIDTDGDGVPDYLDQCPGTPAGVAVDDVGCPIDSDGDGVPDYIDECPDTPAGDVVDSKGCTCGRTLDIEFEFDSFELTAESKQILDEVIEAALVRDWTEGSVTGHTDSIGDADYNLQLSKKRAQAVIDYLVAGGVAEGRLTADGKGESEPVASNDTPEGRAENRRVHIARTNCD